MITYPLNKIEYQATDAELFHCTRNSGIYAGDDFVCTVTGADNNVTIGAGIGWIRNSKFSGKVIANKSDVVLDLGLADAILNRWDIVAIQFDKSNNATDFVVKHGTLASTPVRPEIVQTETLYELYLAAFYRKAGATTINASDVYDLRLDPTVCGLMADSITEIDTTGINVQINALIEKLKEEIAGIESSTEIMLKSVYDTDGDGVVDDAEKLNGQPASYYATKTEVETAQTTADNTVKKAGDTMTGVLTIDTTEIRPILLKIPTAEKNVVPTTNQYSSIHVYDKNDTSLAKIQYAQRTGGSNDFTLQISNKDNVSAEFQIGIDVNGKPFAKLNGSRIGEKDTLWTNASPTSAMDSQFLSFKRSNYKFLLVESHISINYNEIVSTIIKNDVNKTYRLSYYGSYPFHREVTIKSNGLNIGIAYKQSGIGSATTDNNGLIITNIYGLN